MKKIFDAAYREKVVRYVYENPQYTNQECAEHFGIGVSTLQR